MNMPLKLFTFALLLIPGVLLTGALHAQTVMSAKPSTTESVVPELASIVVLCATEQEEKFKEEWAAYVKQNKLEGAELKKAIRKISNEAELYRAREKKSRLRTAEGRNWKAEQQKIMREVAERSSITAR